MFDLSANQLGTVYAILPININSLGVETDFGFYFYAVDPNGNWIGNTGTPLFIVDPFSVAAEGGLGHGGARGDHVGLEIETATANYPFNG